MSPKDERRTEFSLKNSDKISILAAVFFVMKFQLEFLNCEIIDYFFIFALEPTPLDFKSFLYAFNFFFGTLMVALE